jgi:hypothetical protein
MFLNKPKEKIINIFQYQNKCKILFSEKLWFVSKFYGFQMYFVCMCWLYLAIPTALYCNTKIY